MFLGVAETRLGHVYRMIRMIIRKKGDCLKWTPVPPMDGR